MRYLLYDVTFSVIRKTFFGVRKFEKRCMVRLNQNNPMSKDVETIAKTITSAWTKKNKKDSIRVSSFYLSGSGMKSYLTKDSIVSPPLIVFQK